jgi:TPR repeat protein
MSELDDRPPLPTDWTRDDVRNLKRAASKHDCEALVTLGDFYRDGLRHPGGVVLVRRDRRAARRCFERAAELGDAQGMGVLADHLSGLGARASDVARAERLYRRSFRNGYSTAAYNLASTYRNRGRYRQAVRWYQRAHDAGDPSALLQLALAQLYGVGTRRDPRAARAKLRRVARTRTRYWPAAVGENVRAMLVVAQALLDGWLLPSDYKHGQRWLLRAAAWDSATAKAMLHER